MNIAVRADIFENDNLKDPRDKIGGKELPIEFFDHMEYSKDGGVYSFYKIFHFPTKGLPRPEVLWALGVIKKIIWCSLGIIFKSPVRYFIPLFLIFPKKTRKNFTFFALKQFADIADWAFNPYYLKTEHCCNMVRELRIKVGEWIDGNYEGEEKELWHRILKICCMIFEYDTAYRSRFQDIAMELNKEWFKKNPTKELARLFEILLSREGKIAGLMIDKYKPFINFLKFKKSLLNKAIEVVDSLDLSGVSWKEFIGADFDKIPPIQTGQRIGPDYGDWYHVSNSTTYNFGGSGFAERWSFRQKLQGDRLRKFLEDGRAWIAKDGSLNFKGNLW